MRLGADGWGPWKGGLGGVPTPLVVPGTGITRSVLLLLLAHQKRPLACGLFVSYCSSLPPLRMHAVIFSPLYSFFVSVAQGDVCPGAGTSTPVEGSRSQPISVLADNLHLKHVFLVILSPSLVSLSEPRVLLPWGRPVSYSLGASQLAQGLAPTGAQERLDFGAV